MNTVVILVGRWLAVFAMCWVVGPIVMAAGFYGINGIASPHGFFHLALNITIFAMSLVGILFGISLMLSPFAVLFTANFDEVASPRRNK